MVQHFCTSAPEFRQHNLIGRFGKYLLCTGFFLSTNHLALLITVLKTYLAHLQFTEAQQATSKSQLLGESIATASPWFEDVLFARPPFPLWRGVWERD